MEKKSGPGPATAFIAAELRAQRARLGLTVDDVAARSGIPRASAARAMQGAHALPVDTLIAVARALELDPGELLTAASAHESRATDSEPPAPNLTPEGYSLAARRAPSRGKALRDALDDLEGA